jgi:methylenetetrahydrofolate reductase (NADPH)
VFYIAERLVKEPLFGCQMCGQCILHNCAYACPTRCPKRLRNGPCGGYDARGHCEVFPERECAWIRVYRYSRCLRRMHEYEKERQPLDHGLFGTSSWYNLICTRTIDLHGRTHRKM